MAAEAAAADRPHHNLRAATLQGIYSWADARPSAARSFSIPNRRRVWMVLQMALISLILALLLHGNLLVGALILLAMMIAAAATASRHARGIKDAGLLSFYSIASGSGIVIVGMFAAGALKADITTLVPVGSMIIANAMNACAQSIERFRADVTAHVGQVEAALALGADPAVTVAPYLQSAVYASLLPRLDMLKSLGIVWVPGVMAGLLVAGTNPIYAGIYQFIVVAMILAASGITGLVATLLIRTRAFSAAEQLMFRPGEPRKLAEVPGHAR